MHTAEIITSAVSNALVARESANGATSWKPCTRKSFALTAAAIGEDGTPLKGRALKKAYWNYVQTTARDLGAAFAHEVVAGRVIATGFSRNAGGTGGALKWETAARFNRHAPGADKPARDPFAALANQLGITVEALKAKLA